MSKNPRDPLHDRSPARRETLQDVLWRWVGDNLYTVAELAALADCAESTMYAYLEERRNFPWKKVRRIATDASSRHGRNALAELLLDKARYEIDERAPATANGCLNDELGPMTEALGMARLSHREGDRRAMTEQINEAERQLENLKAERDRL